MRYAYPCNIVRDEEEARTTGREAYNVTFPDVYGANTGGWSWDEAMAMAEDCLVAALAAHVEVRRDIPAPSALEEGQALISVPPIVAAKLALYTAMREQELSKVGLAARMGVSEGAIRKLMNPGHRSHIRQVEKALKHLDRQLVVEDGAVWNGGSTPKASATTT
jgi:antitoxin HicB